MFKQVISKNIIRANQQYTRIAVPAFAKTQFRFYAAALSKEELVSNKLNDIVKSFIAEKGISFEKPMTESLKLSEDLKLDSLDKIELVVAIEEEFELEINEDASDAFENLGQIKKFLAENS
ncbi:hypothetical protein QEN19_002582 [Hanseniaspora menglaensis]